MSVCAASPLSRRAHTPRAAACIVTRGAARVAARLTVIHKQRRWPKVETLLLVTYTSVVKKTCRHAQTKKRGKAKCPDAKPTSASAGSEPLGRLEDLKEGEFPFIFPYTCLNPFEWPNSPPLSPSSLLPLLLPLPIPPPRPRPWVPSPPPPAPGSPAGSSAPCK
jgi:hypothetical protein